MDQTLKDGDDKEESAGYKNAKKYKKKKKRARNKKIKNVKEKKLDKILWNNKQKQNKEQNDWNRLLYRGRLRPRFKGSYTPVALHVSANKL